jgi:hypothetical protein
MPNEPGSSGHAVRDSPRPLNAASYHPTAASVLQFLEGAHARPTVPGGRMFTGPSPGGCVFAWRRIRTGAVAHRTGSSSTGVSLCASVSDTTRARPGLRS